MKKKTNKVTAPRAWNRYSEGRCFYFRYPNNERTRKLLETDAYAIVQLVCIDHTARDAFMAGFRAGKRTSNPGVSHGKE